MTTKLILPLTFGAAVASAAGCVVTGDATITARWDLKHLATNTITACPAGFTTAELNSQLVDLDDRPVGPPTLDLFSCADGFGVTAPLPPDRYQVWVDIRSDDGAQLYASSGSAFVDLVDTDQDFDTVILDDGGYFQLDWNLVGKQTNRALTCADIIGGIDSVEAITTSISNHANTFDDRFTCEDHFGISGGLVAGDYTISIDAEAGTKSVGTAAAMTETINTRNRVTDLGSITIPIDGQ